MFIRDKGFWHQLGAHILIENTSEHRTKAQGIYLSLSFGTNKVDWLLQVEFGR
ncbi:hypothetical protein GCM10011571_12050 [Marinithermofilum abyssi]|uniref:Uncharacterized protein n=1 Tax=Marinithermofilum abyssi TaxID=1571185 RepID=A0A8J2VGV7_9BACL|nr:hypothetical protein GCM10011571_12050 [Marinithermofilum abyssi]